MPDATPHPLLRVSDACKSYGGSYAVAHTNLTLEQGEILVIVGPSGSGKSTLLKLIGGFEDLDCGEIALKGNPIGHLPPEKRGIGMVFQDYALFPHMTVLQNVMFAAHRQPAPKRQALAMRYLEMLGMANFVQRYPHQLSGGQQQRVAVARTFASSPQLVLLDEPFSSIDESMRAHARQEIRAILQQSGLGVIMVTHDCVEALSFANRICIMNQGKVVQTGTPEEVYRQPADAFVAGFIAQTNLFPATVEDGAIRFALGVCASNAPHLGASPQPSGKPRLLSIRPEDLEIIAQPQAHSTQGIIQSVEFHGNCYFYMVMVNGQPCCVRGDGPVRFEPGQLVAVQVKSANSAVLV